MFWHSRFLKMHFISSFILPIRNSKIMTKRSKKDKLFIIPIFICTFDLLYVCKNVLSTFDFATHVITFLKKIPESSRSLCPLPLFWEFRIICYKSCNFLTKKKRNHLLMVIMSLTLWFSLTILTVLNHLWKSNDEVEV